jgi:hypothetical protein
MATGESHRDDYINDNLNNEAAEQPIRLMAAECNELFDECLESSVSSPQHPISLQVSQIVREYRCRFDGWCTFLGVFGAEDTALDHRLRRHVALQDMILRMLDMLRQNLFFGKKFLHQVINTADSASDGPRLLQCEQ